MIETQDLHIVDTALDQETFLRPCEASFDQWLFSINNPTLNS